MERLMNKMFEVLQAGHVHSVYMSDEAFCIKYCSVNCYCNKQYTQ